MSAEIIQLHQTKQFAKKHNGWQSVWMFRTAQYCVALEIKRRAYDPGWDLDSKQQGELEYFFARVAVYKHGRVIDYSMGADGGAEAESPTIRHFYTHHFDPDPMLRNCSIRRAKHGADSYVDQHFRLLVRDAISEVRWTMKTGRYDWWKNA